MQTLITNSRYLFTYMILAASLTTQFAFAARPFSAECVGEKHEYLYWTGIEGTTGIDEWIEGEMGGKWTFIYTGEKYLVVNDKQLPIVAETEFNLAAIDAGTAPAGVAITSYAVSLGAHSIVMAKVHAGGPFLGSRVSTAAMNLTCEFRN